MQNSKLAVKITKQKLHNFAIQGMIKYGTYTIENRALPDYRDGLKPVQRRLLWTMDQATPRFSNNGPYVKAARITGECFAAGTPVSTPEGKIPLENLQVGDLVKTSQDNQPVIGLIKNPITAMYKAEFSNGKFLVLTKTQEIKVEINGKFYWKPANEVNPTDKVVVEIDV